MYIYKYIKYVYINMYVSMYKKETEIQLHVPIRKCI